MTSSATVDCPDKKCTLCAVSTPNTCSTATGSYYKSKNHYTFKHKKPCTQASPGYFLTGDVVLAGNSGTCSPVYNSAARTCDAYGKSAIQTVTCMTDYEQTGTNTGTAKDSSYLDVSCKLSCTANCRDCEIKCETGVNRYLVLNRHKCSTGIETNVCTACAPGYGLQSDNTCVQLAAVSNSVGNLFDGFSFKPHTELQERTVEASVYDCWERCNSVDGCFSFAYYPLKHCHLNSNAAAVKTEHSLVQSGLSGTPYTGNAGK